MVTLVLCCWYWCGVVVDVVGGDARGGDVGSDCRNFLQNKSKDKTKDNNTSCSHSYINVFDV